MCEDRAQGKNHPADAGEACFHMFAAEEKQDRLTLVVALGA